MLPLPRQLAALTLSLGALACSEDAPRANLEHSPSTPTAGASSGGQGAGTDGTTPATDALRRLTRPEYRTTIEALFGVEVATASAAALASHPSDAVRDGFATMAVEPTLQHVEAYLNVAEAIAEALIGNEALRSGLSPCLARLGDRSCIQTLAASWGERAYRRPLREEEQAALLTRYDDGAKLSPEDGFRSFLTSLLLAPPFLYRLEIEGEEQPQLADGTRRFALTDHELATRLAYATVGGPPDDELRNAANGGELVAPDGVQRQLARLLEKPEARANTRRFFAEWLGFAVLPEVQQPDEFLVGVPRAGLREAMTEELGWFVEELVFNRSGKYADLLTSPWVNPQGPLLDVYGVNQPGPIALDGGWRNGILTRAGMLLSPQLETNPVRRGVRVLRQMLCVKLSVPPPDALGQPIEPPAFDAQRTARERWTDKTSSPPCAGCHGLLNPYGFAFESYDTLGRVRQREPVLEPTTKTVVNELAIDTNVTLTIDGAEVSVGGGAELGAALANSEQALDCFARQWFRYLRGREESTGDTALLSAMVEAGASDAGSMLESFRTLAHSEAFRTKYLSEETKP